MTDCYNFLYHAIEVEELKVLAVSFDLAFVILLYLFVEHVVEPFGVLEELHFLFSWFGGEMGIGKGGETIAAEVHFVEFLL